MPTDAARLLAAVQLTRYRVQRTGEASYAAASFAPLFNLDRSRVAELAARAEAACRQARAILREKAPADAD